MVGELGASDTPQYESNSLQRTFPSTARWPMAVDERDYCQNPVPPGVAIAHATGDRHNGTVPVRTDACWRCL